MSKPPLLNDFSIKSTLTFQVKSFKYKISYNDSSTLSLSRIQTLTPHSIRWSILFSNWNCIMIPWTWFIVHLRSIFTNRTINNPMMTRRDPRKNIYRSSHISCNKRLTMRNNSIYYLRSTFFLCIFLSIFP